MNNDPNAQPHHPEPHAGQGMPAYQGQGQPFSQQQPHPGQPFPPQYQQGQQFPSQYPQSKRDPDRSKGRFGVSFWIVGVLLALLVLINAFNGNGESILIFLGLAAGLTGLYALIFKRRSWAGLTGRTPARAVAIAGAASLLIGVIAVGSGGSRDRPVAATEPVTSATLEADAAAKLAAREAAVKTAEDAVKAREAAVGGAEAGAAANIIKEGTWTVGKDISPGTYRTTKELMSACHWVITVTGSNGGNTVDSDYIKGGFPQVVLSEGHTFESSRCGTWAKQ